MVLSDRMQTIADMVIPGESAADIGTDHGYIPAYLLSSGKCPEVILTDINSGPLERAKANLRLAGIEKPDIRQGSGISVLGYGEVSTVIIAGMGGELISDIILSDIEKARSFKKIILQPRKRSDALRKTLSEHSFRLTEFRLAREGRKISEIFSVVPAEEGSVEPDTDPVCPVLESSGDPLLREYILLRIASAELLLDNLNNSRQPDREELLEKWTSYKRRLESCL